MVNIQFINTILFAHSFERRISKRWKNHLNFKESFNF